MIQYNPEIEDIKNLYLNYAVLIYPSETEKKWHNFESAVAGLDFAVEGLNNTIAVINDKLESIKEDKEKILTVLYGELEKGIFEYEQDSVPRYNEIGDFYYKNKKLEEAIYYYQKVLSIEPNNINAIYYLGTIFEQNNEWYRASENYKLAFKLDPAYYQAASKYNQVTERHPRLLKNDFTFYIEPSYSTFEEKLSIETHINQVLGIRAHYIYIHRTEKLSLNKDVDEFPVTFNNPLLRIGIDYQELQYGMPVNIKNKIVLTPYARIGLAGLYSGYDVIQDEDWEIVDNYFNFKLAGGGGLIAELPFRYVVPGFSVDVYAQPETMRPFFKTVYYIKGQVKLVTNFSFWNFYPFREITMLNNIDFYYNFDGKMELDTYNEINYNIVNLAEIGFLLGLRLDATYETKLPTDTPVPETYWMPDGELSYGARLGISEDFEKIRPPIRLEVYGYIGHVITNLNTDSISYLRWKTGGSLYWDISYLTLGFTIDYISTDSFKHTDLSYSSMSISIKAVLRFPDVIKF
jgi:tetratricopeptide (TPR) repeat protein